MVKVIKLLYKKRSLSKLLLPL